ncbi:MAG: hypothetical protein ABGY24_10810 [bacterium]
MALCNLLTPHASSALKKSDRAFFFLDFAPLDTSSRRAAAYARGW